MGPGHDQVDLGPMAWARGEPAARRVSLPAQLFFAVGDGLGELEATPDRLQVHDPLSGATR